MATEDKSGFLSKPAVVQYWGQNSAGATGDGQQEPLASYCDDVTDVLVIAFINEFNIGGSPGLSLPCGSDCSSVGSGKSNMKNIKTCQESGHTILLSLGGAVGAYGFTDDSQATEFAKTLWDTFGNGAKGGERPFGDAVIDGFDLDIEGGTSTGYVQLIAELRSLFKSDDSGKQYYLTAAPQCPFPDARMGTDITSGLDAVFVQFYNNPCGISGAFNFDTWDAWASGAGVKVLIGIPGAPHAAGSGYVTIDTLSSTLSQVSSSSSYGGVMVWDASQSYSNTDPSPNFATALGKLVHGGALSSETNHTTLGGGGNSSHSIPVPAAGSTATTTTTDNGGAQAPTATSSSTGDYNPYTTSVWAPTTESPMVPTTAAPGPATITATTTLIQAQQLAVTQKPNTDHCRKNKPKEGTSAVPHKDQLDDAHVKHQ
ncbi:glycoside hydrolase superfamily [Dichotomocladium elegans]|nr:glycoside hydrolase superfamily [Dichotomocladium elegans]